METRLDSITLVSQVDFMLHSANPHYQLTMSTYASAAGDPNGFYDIPGLSKWVNAFFVMAYDVSQGATGARGRTTPPTWITMFRRLARRRSSSPCPCSDMTNRQRGRHLGEATNGPAEPVTYAQAVSSGPTYWDAATDTAWTSYPANGQWHQVFFDNANTLAGKVQLAAKSGLLGVGVWALGMEGNDNSVLGLLNGAPTSLRTPPAGPTTSSAAASIVKKVKIKSRTGDAATTSHDDHRSARGRRRRRS